MMLVLPLHQPADSAVDAESHDDKTRRAANCRRLDPLFQIVEGVSREQHRG
jgi:hypothetical protein